MESTIFNIKVIFVILLFVSVAFIEAANACLNTSGDGCPTIVEIDDNAATFTGNWSRSQSILLWYGDDYEVVQGGGTFITATATFTTPVDLEVAGTYSIYARWTAHHNRCANATYKIYNGIVSPANQIATVTKDQTVNGGAWQRLGTFQFIKNAIPSIVVDNGGCGGKFVVADGIRIVREESDHYSIVDEAGVEFASGTNQDVTLGILGAIVRSITITPPADGYVVVNATGYFAANAGETTALCSIVQHPDIVDSNSAIGGYVEGGNTMPFAVTRVFEVSNAVSTTFHLGCAAKFGTKALNSSLTGIFSTTRY